MGMAKSRGVLPKPNCQQPKHCFDVPPIDPKQVDYSTVPVNVEPTDVVNAEQYIARSVSDLGTVSEEDQKLALLAAYSEGSVITVTFYHQQTSDTYGRSTYNTFSESLDSIHQNYLKINNFQMKLKDAVAFNYNPEATQSQVTGEAILYPYFCPYQGDMFIYETRANKLGLFKITEIPQRLSISGATCHSIKFMLYTWITDDILSKLNDCVTDEAYFDLQTFLNGQGALITSDELDLENKAQKTIDVLTHRYIADFLETKIYRSFIENACLYDPYLVEFCLKLFDCKDLPIYPQQLVPNPEHWTESFWYSLLDPDYTPPSIVVNRAVKLNKAINYRTTKINALSNRCFIQLDKSLIATYNYPPFLIPKKWDKEEITVPMQIRLYFDQRKVYPSALLELANQMLSVRRVAAFYFIPIVIFLLKKMLAALKSGDSNILYQDPEKPKDTNTCVCDCSDCIFSCNPPHMKNMVRCPGHQHHSCSFDKRCNTIFIPPCGGCSTDPDAYPLIYHRRARFFIEDEYKRYHRDLSKVPPKRLPMYGPGRTPIHCDHPPVPPMDPNQASCNKVDDMFYYDENDGTIHEVSGLDGIEFVDLRDGDYDPSDDDVWDATD